MTDFNYKKYSLEKLEEWVHDALSGEATPQEIYNTIKEVVVESRQYHKHHASRAYELMCLLNGNGNWTVEEVLKEREYYEGGDNITASNLICDKDDSSPECKGAWNDFWEESYQYTDEELDAMCDKAASDIEKDKCREYNLREAEYYNKRAELDAEYDKVVKWRLPVQQGSVDGVDDYYVEFPDDLLEAANLKAGDTVEWVDQGNGSYLLRKV